MSALPNDTFYAPGQSYYVKANEPLVVPNPFQVEDNTGSFVTEIDTTEIGGGGILGRSTLALKTTGGTLLSEVTLSGLTSSSLSAFNVNVGQPGTLSTLVVDGGLGVQTYAPITIFDTATPHAMQISSTHIASGGGSVIDLETPKMVINTNVTIDTSANIVANKPGGGADATLTPTDLTFTTASASAKMGTSGTIAYFGFGTAPVANPGVSVDSNQSATIQFTDGTNKGTLQMSGSNIVLGTASAPTAISIDPAGVVDIPNLTYPATINTTTLNAVYGNFTSNLSATDISANFVYAPVLSCLSLNSTGPGVATTALNGNLLSASNMIEYQPTPTYGVATAGAVGAWVPFLSVPVSSNLVKYPTMDFHMPPMNIDSQNLPNFIWDGAIGVVGSNIGITPITYKTYSGINGYTGFGGGGTTKDQVNGSCYILRSGVDYDVGTSNFVIYVQGNANNPSYNVLAGPSNIMMRAYPF